MTMLTRKSLLAAKIESTPGTDASLAAADAAMHVFNPAVVPQVSFTDREAQGSFNRLASVPGGYGGQATFRTYLDDWDGSSSKPKWADTFLPACGWVLDTNTYGPLSEAPGSNVKTLTIALYRDGRRALLTGCAGTFTLTLQPGVPPYFDWTFTGVWQGVTDAALLSPTYPTDLPLRYAGDAATATWNSTSLCFAQAQINAGNNVVLRECANAPTDQAAAGYHSAIVTDRQPRITIDPESALVATQDRFGKFLDMSEHSLAFSVPGPAGAVSDAAFAIEAPKAQIVSIQDADRNRILTDQIEFAVNKNGATADDELTFTLTPLADA